MIVIYHGNCYDGFTAAWLFWREHPGADFYPAVYGQFDIGDVPVEGRDVVMVDFSLKRDEMIRLNKRAASFVCLDHHKTAEAELEGLDFCVFDMEKSGAQLAWIFLHDHDDVGPPPSLVEYTADRDLWRFSLPDSRQINALVAASPMTFDTWDGLHEALDGGRDSFHGCVLRGRSVLDYIDRYCEKAGAEAVMMKIPIATQEGGRNVSDWGEPLVVPVVNAPYMNTSELVGSLAGAHPFAVGWFQRKDGRFQYSLRSREDESGTAFDVSELARQHGGGGHHSAAGFDSKRAPWELWP